jgi:hypothetical protein
MSHTPGPWKFKVVDETDSFLGCKRLDGGGVSTVIDLSDEWTGYRECGQDLQMTISKDDAALIEAAPDMLEALEEMADMNLCTSKGLVAIRKARGEE